MKTIALLMAVGLSVSGCGKHEADSAANTDLVYNDDAESSEFAGNSDALAENTTLPADEGNSALSEGENSTQTSNAR